MDSGIRILLADDHPTLREGLVAVLDTQPDLEVAGEAATGEEAVRRTLDLAPDILLLDLELPGLDGVGVLERLREARAQTRTIVFTAFDDARVFAALRAGAKGYLLKGAARGDLFDAIRKVHAGGTLLAPAVTDRLVEGLAGGLAPSDPLTDRELEVLHLLAEGLQNKEIAARLYVTERTVKFHVSSILGKLGVSNRTEAARIALQNGLVEPR